MTDTRYLVHGVFWDAEPAAPAAPATPDGGHPAMRLQDPDGGFTELPLDAGTRLGFRLAAAGKHCLGHHKVHGPADRDHVLCPDRAPAVKGSQCERCFVVDDSRLIHDFHRGGRVPPGLRAYLMQPHWLYVATFANGASKVGTAVEPAEMEAARRAGRRRRPVRRPRRRRPGGQDPRGHGDPRRRPAAADPLRRQGRGPDRAGARRRTGRPERPAGRRRSASCWPAPGEAASRSWTSSWVRPGLSDAVCAPAARHAYPHELSTGAHGFRIDSLSGSIALAAARRRRP